MPFTSYPADDNAGPKLPTPFVGRDSEIVDIVQRLANPECRLLTLVGQGGIGKTRLALESARVAAPSFTHGYVWVALQPVTSADLVLDAIIEALGYTVSSLGDPLHQLANFLAARNLLLVLDNFEHVVEAADLLAPLLDGAPDLKLLVSSREPLNLRSEWVVRVDGLAYPGDDSPDGTGDSALQLFAATARRVQPDFNLEQERADVIRICAHVAGIPLAIELAASWRQTLTSAEIADDLEQRLDLLTARMRDLPPRHRDMTALFDQTCALLPDPALDVFERLSVFRGGFTRAGAVAVAGATTPILAALVDKSLLRYDADGRFSLHELTRQYAAERLARAPQKLAETRRRHGITCLTMLANNEAEILGGDQKQTLDTIERDFDNIRAAWRWATETAEADVMRAAAVTFTTVCQMKSRYSEAADVYERATIALSRRPPDERIDRALALMLVHLAGFYLRIGRLTDAEIALESSIERYRRLGIPPLPGFSTDPAFNLGILALIRGDYAEAWRLGDAMLDTVAAHPHPNNEIMADYLLTQAALAQGDYETAREFAQAADRLLAQLGNRWFMAYIHNQLGTIAYALHDSTTAQHHYEASYAIRAEFNDPEGMAMALSYLGIIALERQAHVEAESMFARSLHIYEDINDRGGVAKTRALLAVVALSIGDANRVVDYLSSALRIAHEIRFVSLTITILIRTAEFLLRTGRPERAVGLLAVGMHDPGADEQTRAEASRLIDLYSLTLPPSPPEPLAAAVDHLLAAFPAPTRELDSAPSVAYVALDQQRLPEPLSERELEVLRCLADGLQNREIADHLYITLGTVKTHINNIYRKLDVRNRVEALARARELDLL